MSTSSATSSGPGGSASPSAGWRPGPLLGEGDEAADGALLLPGEGAAGPVGDGGEQVVDRGRVVGFGVPRAHLRQPGRQGEAVLLARRALPARLDGEEAGDARRGGEQVDVVGEHDQAGGTEPAAGVAHRLVGHRRVELVAGENGVGDSHQHGGDTATDLDAAADRLDGGSDRRAHRDLGDTRPLWSNR